VFSVIIPVFNKFPHLERSIYSVLNQTFSDFELILVDDGSTDGSLEKLSEFDDSRIRIFKRVIPGPGGYAARNLGISKAKYDWICFLDADDLWKPEFLNEYYHSIKRNPNLLLFSSAWEVHDGTMFNPAKIFSHFPLKSFQKLSFKQYLELCICNAAPICTLVVVFNKSLIQGKENLFPDGKCKSGGDVDAWFKLLSKKSEIGFTNKILATYHVDSVNMVTKNTFQTEVPCIVLSVKDYINSVKEKSLEIRLKKYSNKYLLAALAKSIRGKSFDPVLISFFYREVDWNKFLILNLFRFNFLRIIYRIYLVKNNPFYGK